MAQLTVRVNADLSDMDRLDKHIASATPRACMQVAQHISGDLRWSEMSPSVPGTPPGIVKGDLSGNVRVVARDAGGRFARAEEAYYATIEFNTDYANVHEFGAPPEMAARPYPPRPYVAPAMERAEALFSGAVTDVWRRWR
jgi:hypothetical protein